MFARRTNRQLSEVGLAPLLEIQRLEICLRSCWRSSGGILELSPRSTAGSPNGSDSVRSPCQACQSGSLGYWGRLLYRRDRRTPTRTARTLEGWSRYPEGSNGRWVEAKPYHPRGRKVDLRGVQWVSRSFQGRLNTLALSEHKRRRVGVWSGCDIHSADHPPAGKKIRQSQTFELRRGRRIRFEPGQYPSPRVLSQVPLPFVPIKLPLSFRNHQNLCDSLSRDVYMLARCKYLNS